MDFSKIVHAFSDIPGVRGIALGGSHSRREADEHSDLDIGLYYAAGDLDLTKLERALQLLDDTHRQNLLNPPGTWGPWINGGAWLNVDNKPVDILLREIKTVEEVVEDCIKGNIIVDYQAGHPFAFVNTIYAAETHYCQPLWQDQEKLIDVLKEKLYLHGPYSPAMRVAVVQKFLWEAWFSLACGRGAAHRGDFNYALGSVFRTVCSWIEVLYALNNRYLMNEKGALSHIGSLDKVPQNMEERVKSSYGLLITGQAKEAYQTLDVLHNEVSELTSEIPQFHTEIRSGD